MDWVKEEQQSIFQTYSRQPMVLVKAKGSVVWDDKNKKYLDFFSGVGVNNLGHGNSRVLKAVQNQVKKLIHVSNHYYTVPQIECAEALIKKTFPGRVFFSNSGSEANECAIKLSRRWGKSSRSGEENKYEIISFQNSFMGRAMGTLSLTGQEKVREGFEPLLDKVHYAEFNNINSVKSFMNSKTAAVFIEPILGEGGVIPADKAFLKELRELCTQNKVLLVFDEIQCGLGRSGQLFSFQHYGVVPDVLTLAKSLAGGLPIGATIATPEVANLFEKGDHGSTFGGSPVSCAAAVQVLKELSPTLLKAVNKKSKILFEKLRALMSQFPNNIADVRGLGLMVGIVLKKPGAGVVDYCREAGLLVNCTQGNVIRLLPPHIVTTSEINQAVKILKKALETF